MLSQFVYYRGVEIGQPGYGQVSAIASAPQVDLQRAGEAHSYLLIPLAAFAVVMAARRASSPSGAGRRSWSRWPASPAVAVTLLIDMPSGLDAGLAGVRFSGAHAVLREGFYAQLAASRRPGDLRRGALARPARRVAPRRGARRGAAAGGDGPRRSRKAPSLAESGT